MNNTIYILAQLATTGIVIGLILLTLLGLNYALRRIRIIEEQRRIIVKFTGLGLLCWLLIIGLLAVRGFFSNFDVLPPRIALAMLPPIVLSVILMRNRVFQLLLKAIPEKWLIVVQVFRIPMELYLWMCFLGGFLPFQMTFEGLNMDILIGITALMAGYFFFWKGRRQQKAAILWNISGLALLLNVVLIATVSTPSPLRYFHNEPSTAIIGDFPFIWIPGFIVPFAVAIHLFSIKQLFMNGR